MIGADTNLADSDISALRELRFGMPTDNPASIKTWGIGLMMVCCCLLASPTSGEDQGAGDNPLAAGAVSAPSGLELPQSLPSGRAAMAALQTALDRQGFGVGLIDGIDGPKTRRAMADFRRARGIANEEEACLFLLDPHTPAFVLYILTSNDLALVGKAPLDWEEAARMPRLACETIQEVISEKFHVSERLLALLNPEIEDWELLTEGAVLRVPNARPKSFRLPAIGWIEVDTRQYRLRAYDAVSNMVASFPCSIAKDLAKAPSGDLFVVAVAPNPNYTFDPANFPESSRAQAIGRRLILPPGPNNPVGVFWIGLNLPGYGVHGTPRPATIGTMESYGCFRLCNWDARTLGAAVKVGMPVRIDPESLTKRDAPDATLR